MKRILLILLWLPVYVHAQTITTIAGTGVAGYNGDGAAATAAAFNHPHSVGFDASGNLYIADNANNCIRKVSSSGVVTTVVGNGTAGFSGDNGPATAAQCNQPFAARINSSGYMIVTDNHNHRVRMVDPSGIITTIAGTSVAGYSGDGGPATAAQFNDPCGIAFDASGNVYIGDIFNHRVRKIDMTTGIITTFAGTGTAGYSGDGGAATLARLNNPNFLHFDATGNLFIADNANHCIRKVNTSGIITTVAGTGTAGYGGDGGPATSSQLNYPGGITTDAAGSIYLADDVNHRVRKVDPLGIIYTLAGTGTAGFAGDNGPATAARLNTVTDVVNNNAGDLFIADFNNHRVRKFSICSMGISGNASVCSGATVTLSSSASGGTWSSSNTSVATINGAGVVTGVSPGTSVISYTGCSVVTATITVTTSPSAITGNTTLCQNTTTSLSNSSPGGSWSSDNTTVATISNTGVVTGTLPGTAQITYATSCGFVLTTVTVNPSAVLSGNITICAGNTTTISSSVSGGTWSSSLTGVATVSNTGSVTGVSTGAATITYTLSGGCFATATVTVNAAPSVISGGPTVCAGYTITLSNAVGGGTWTSGNVSIATVSAGVANTGRVGGVSPGVAIITYTTGAGCLATISITVLPATPGADTIRGASGVCTGSTIPLSNATPGGVWSSNAPGIATINNAGTVTGVTAGSATISYTITGVCGTSFKTKTITVVAAPNAGTITGAGSVCEGAAITLSDNVAGGEWSSGATNVATVSATGVVTGVVQGSTTIIYSVTNACGTATTTKNIAVLAAPVAGSITGKDSVCKGAVYSLQDVIPGGIWSSSNAAVATIDSNTGRVHALTGGTTMITYTVGPNAGGCYGIATFVLTVNDEPTFTISGVLTNPKCYAGNDGSIAVTISGTNTTTHYLWSTGATTATINGLGAGAYLLNVNEPETQCIKADSFHLSSPDSMVIAATIKNDVCNAGLGSINVTTTGGIAPYNYLWSNNATGSELAAATAGTYSVSVTDSNSCVKTFAATILDDSCSNVVIHDAITPNGDGINDTWVIEGISAYPGNSVNVFDKWGDAVYTKTDYKNDWNGTGKSGVLPDGTYFYIIKLPANGVKSEQVFTGAVMVKR